jgi:hypothetical protein
MNDHSESLADVFVARMHCMHITKYLEICRGYSGLGEYSLEAKYNFLRPVEVLGFLKGIPKAYEYKLLMHKLRTQYLANLHEHAYSAPAFSAPQNHPDNHVTPPRFQTT